MVGRKWGLYAYHRKKGRANNAVDGTFRNNIGVSKLVYAYVENNIGVNNAVDGTFRNNIGVSKLVYAYVENNIGTNNVADDTFRNNIGGNIAIYPFKQNSLVLDFIFHTLRYSPLLTVTIRYYNVILTAYYPKPIPA